MRITFGALAAFLLATSATAQPRAAAPSSQAQRLPIGTETRPVQLSRVIFDLERGSAIGRLRGGMFCFPYGSIRWRTEDTREIENVEFGEVFREEIRRVGFRAAGSSDSLFEDAGDSRAEFLVGGRIDRLDLRICYPLSHTGDTSQSQGSVSIRINWEIFSQLERRVVGTLTTEASYEQGARTGGPNDILLGAFAAAVRQLAASDQFRQVFVGAPMDPTRPRTAATTLAPLRLVTGTAFVDRLPDAVGATVLIQSGGGHGSGFLVGADGHVLTNHHVVGDARFVRVRWSDGLEALGEVLRSDRGRDVALVRVDARNRSPIRIRREPAVQGENVFAIGAPLDPGLQSSVTRGIVSANRILDGFSYVQSDVAVNPGNSGGPLLDERHRVIGITVSGAARNGVPLGINMFVPIADALAFLGLQESEGTR